MDWSIMKGTLSRAFISRFLPGKYCLSNCSLQGSAITWFTAFRHNLFTTAINLCFAVIFLIVLIISRGYRSRYSYMYDKRPAINSVSLFLSSIIGLANFGFAIQIAFENLDKRKQESILYCIQGLTWVVLAISLKLNLKKPPAIVAITWWTIEFVLGSLLAFSSIAKVFSTETFSAKTILDITTWVNCFLLLCCAIKAVRCHTFISTKDLSDPLLEETAEEEIKVTPLSKAGFLSRLTFRWLDPLLHLGYSKTLELKDIPHLPSEDEAFTAQKAFAEAWDLLKNQDPLNKQTIFKALSKCYWKDMVVTGVFAFMRSAATISAPLFMRSFVQLAGREQSFQNEKIILVGGLFAVKLIESFSQRQWYFNSRRTGMRMRSALMAAVYQKQLRLSSLGRRRHATGEIVNYIAVDAYRFGEFPWWLHWGWTVPLQICVAIGILFATVGWATIPGLLIIILTLILNKPLAKTLQKCQAEFMTAQDERLRITSEILNSMKIIKLQAWEEKFKELIENLRAVEFKWLSSAQFNRTYGTILYWMSPIITASTVFAGCAIIGDPPLTATTIFTVLATFRVIQEPVRMLPDVLAILIQVKVSLHRLDKFLQDDELRPDSVVRKALAGSQYTIEIHQAILSWDPESSLTKPTLKGINLHIKTGEKVAICGSVGSGKSALLYTILGEIPKISGDVEVYGSVAYVAQTAWIQSGTVRDNILYGKPMDKIQYKKAIKACALDKDIESFAHGDMTEIGERGLNMSGGQKQRIQLARAVYNDADIYLLDDPFSAVDAHTASTLFNDCVMGALAMKTVVLVTHQVEFLPAVNKILVMEDGEIKEAGSYEQILTAGQTFEQLVNAHKEAMTSADPVNYPASVGSQQIDMNPLEPPRTQSAMVREESVADISFNTGQLIAEEKKETGDVGLQQYCDYIRVAEGALLFFCIVILQGAFVVAQAGSNYWLASAILNPNIDSGLLVGVYACISLLSGAFVYGRARLVVLLSLRASKAFFSGMINSIFRAPMAFFDTTPVGRLLIRASSDMSLLDVDIAWAYSYVLSAGSDLIGMIFIISLSVWFPFSLIRFLLILLFLSGLNAVSHQKLEATHPLNVSHFFNFHPNTTSHHGEGHGFPLFSLSATTAARPSFLINALSKKMKKQANANLSASKAASTARVSFRYGDTLMVEVMVGTPSQKQRMVLDTGSELSWLHCAHKASKPPPFDPTLSPSYNSVPCNSPVCTQKTVDFPVPASCDAKRLCSFTYSYADGTDVEGNLGSDVVTFQPTSTAAAPLRIPGVVLGCASAALPGTPGLMGLNRGALSFVSQLQTVNIPSKFSYCIADRFLSPDSPGLLYFGNCPFAQYLHYTQLFTISLPLPYFNRAAYSVRLQGIKVGNKLLPIPKSVFLPDHTGAGQTMIDSGTQFTFLLGEAYTPLKQEFMQQNRGLLKNPMGENFVFQGAMDLCYQQPANAPFPQMLSPVTLLFDSAQITLSGHQLLYKIPERSAGDNIARGRAIYCFTFGNSDLVPVEANIIGNHHQQNLWIEYDVQNSRIGFAQARCNIN